MDNFNFSEAFLDVAFKALILNDCETDEEKETFNILCEICARYHISIRDYIQASQEFEKRIKELNDENAI